MRFRCDKKEACLGCAECCRFREKSFIDKDVELKMKKSLFYKTGVLYLYPFSTYTINITPEEKIILEKEAKTKNITLNLMPKKIFIMRDTIHIYDYSIDTDACPFLENNRCSIYEKRPAICKQFPRLSYDNKDFVKFQNDNQIIKDDYEKRMREARERLL